MFLLFGTRNMQTLLVVVHFVCPHCGVDAEQRVYKASNRFTLFFVPLFSISSSWFVACSNCGRATGLTKQQAEHSLEWAAKQVR